MFDIIDLSFIFGLSSIFLILLILFMRSKSQDISSFVGKRSVLLITAHPDDECMFFAPTVLALTAKWRFHFVLLCLSEGNYYKQGSIRKEELSKSASVLGVVANNVVVVNDSQLPDSPSVEWDQNVLGKHILKAIEQNHIEMVITFDERGVSGHPNHIALCRAVRKLHEQGQFVNVGVHDVFLLETTSILHKYSSSVDILWSLAFAKYHSVCDWNGYFKGRRAMQEHRSQYIWFRKVYVLFSRYMFVNTFKKL